MFRQWFVLFAALALSGVLLIRAEPDAQQAPTSTPLVINLSPVASPQQQSVGAGTPTITRTPTPLGIALLEAKDFANVRSQPSTDAAQLGTIRSGTKYNVIGRYVSWIEFQYPSSPTGTGWVFGDLVSLTGNLDNIPDINPYTQANNDPNALNATGTQSILTQTPGGVLTATAQSQLVAPGGTPAPTDNGTHEILPTFTFPPGMVAIAPTQGALQSTLAPNAPPASLTPDNSVPPLVPIVLLAGLGVLGLAINSLRRN